MGKGIPPLEAYGGGGAAAGPTGATRVEDPSRNVPVRQRLVEEAKVEWSHIARLRGRWNNQRGQKRRDRLAEKIEWHAQRLMRVFGSMTPAEQAAYHTLTGTPPITPIGLEPAGK
ncbi:MAG: hypothetical protein KGJ23_07835 [Euryarchaeota archaeon]|nr:hypothetical protein [Euryarchaeota archaeon]MDE1836510.1 hypothetical protein [Euryarchaeota archaeon]MDE1879295.1 hypothetical protein [Euryarchaeota archaeon]MDE2044480.1 hypothetical protein [Thermoplasmata archaeon]